MLLLMPLLRINSSALRISFSVTQLATEIIKSSREGYNVYIIRRAFRFKHIYVYIPDTR